MGQHIVKKPVLYFHSRDKKPFSLKVVFPNGQPAFTFPHAVTLDHGLEWTGVKFTENPKDGSPALPTTDVIDREETNAGFYCGSLLNDVDADEMEVAGKRSRFLFYEGQVDYQEKVSLKLKGDLKTAVVQNQGSTPVYDLFISFGKNKRVGVIERTEMALWGSLGRLEPGQTALVPLSPAENLAGPAKPAGPAFPNLRKIGFTGKEASAFEKCWVRAVEYTDNTQNWQSLLYRLAPKDCDRLSELHFTPAPAKVIRALFVLDQAWSWDIAQPANTSAKN